MQTPTADISPLPPLDVPKPGPVVSGIREAADTTGVSFDFLLAQATQESGLNPQARNTKSTASGLFQFTTPTWLDMIRRHGADHGLEKEAAAIIKGPDGKLDILDKDLKKAVLDLRKDPKFSSVMAAEYAKDNAKSLEHRLGRAATASDLYLAHFLGASGAARVIEGMEATPRHSAHQLLPDAARANPDVFRKANTVAGLYKSVQARFKSALAPSGTSATSTAVTGRADLAALRPAPRPAPPIPEIPVPQTQLVAAVAPPPPVSQISAVETRIRAMNAFARAIQPESPFFPAAIPPAPSVADANIKPDDLTLRGIFEAMDTAKDV
ncbi:conserved hypothetical protein [Candidatus Terasakiella magnetica]|nr:conserved hypothetical protein [Candidatus Terasakiella magnetica]